MSVTLLEVMAAAQARRAPLVAELAGYLVLGAADQSAGAPRYMGAADVVLGEDGSVRLVGAGTACASAAAEEALRGLLGQLMGVASSATPALFRSTQRAAGAGVDALIRELETALIPVNRAAARRSLSRLHRETARAIQSGQVDVEALETTEPRAGQQEPPDPQQSLPGLEPVAAPAAPAPDPEPVEWSVPIALLQSSPEPAPAEPLPRVETDAPCCVEEETAPEPAVVRARGAASEDIVELPSSVLEVVLELSPLRPGVVELSPPQPEILELSPPEPIVALLPETRTAVLAQHTPVVGTFCTSASVEIPLVDGDMTDRVPPVFEPEQTRPLELDAEMTPDIKRDVESADIAQADVAEADVAEADVAQEDVAEVDVAEVAEADVAEADVAEADVAQVAQLAEDLDDEDDVEWVEMEASEKPALCRNGEPFAVAPSADPPEVGPQSRSSVVVFRGAPRVVPDPEPPALEPTPPLRIPGVERTPTPSAPPRFAPRQSDVSELLANFGVAGTPSESQLRGDLKRMAGLEPTPPPAEAQGAEPGDDGGPGAGDPAACEAR